MTWKELCTMSVREKFVLRASEARSNKAALCREFGISRKTGYKWLKRYAESGLQGLDDLTRKPNQSPLKISGEIVAAIVRLRRAHGWGARKLAFNMRYERPDLPHVSPSTAHRVLVRAGMLQPARQRKARTSNGLTEPSRVEFKEPNDLWTVDFKGWWLSMDKKRCESWRAWSDKTIGLVVELGH
jgi:putative transposase